MCGFIVLRHTRKVYVLWREFVSGFFADSKSIGSIRRFIRLAAENVYRLCRLQARAPNRTPGQSPLNTIEPEDFRHLRKQPKCLLIRFYRKQNFCRQGDELSHTAYF